MGSRVLVVQHGQKERTAGDPGLTPLGTAQARAAARWMAAGDRPFAVWASPQRRAVETAEVIGGELGLSVRQDPRLRERMNWNGKESLDQFLEQWRLASADRTLVPASGDSSLAAADRFLAALADVTDSVPADAQVVVVAHGGVTTDALRTILGDDELTRRAPSLVDEGIPGGRITILERQAANHWSVDAIAFDPGRWSEVVAAASELLDRRLVALGPTRRGESASTLRVRDDGGELIVEVVAGGAPENQYRLLRIVSDLRARGYPAPELLGAGRSGGSAFIVQRVLPGEPLEPAPGALPDAGLLDRIVPEVLAAVELQRDAGDLSSVPWPAWLLDTIRYGGDGYCLHETMRQRDDTSDLLDRVIVRTERHARGACRATDVVHFDLNPANILHVDGHLTGIVDWNVPFDGAAQGDRGFDVATLLFYLYDHEPARRRLWHAAVGISGRDWVAVYLCHLILRQVEWSVRHRPGSAEEERFLGIADSVLDHLA